MSGLCGTALSFLLNFDVACLSRGGERMGLVLGRRVVENSAHSVWICTGAPSFPTVRDAVMQQNLSMIFRSRLGAHFDVQWRYHRLSMPP